MKKFLVMTAAGEVCIEIAAPNVLDAACIAEDKHRLTVLDIMDDVVVVAG